MSVHDLKTQFSGRQGNLPLQSDRGLGLKETALLSLKINEVSNCHPVLKFTPKDINTQERI